MTPRTVTATEVARTRGDVDSVIASLPVSLAQATTASADLRAIEGTAGRPEQAERALSEGAAGLVIVHPIPADAARLLTAAAERRVSIVVDSPWFSNPVVVGAANRFRDARADGSRVEAQVVVGLTDDLDAALVDLLLLLDTLLGPVDRLHLLSKNEHGFQAEAVAAGTAVDFLTVRSDARAPHAFVRLLTADGAIELEIPFWDTADPARLVVTTSAGAMTSPTLYESAHRSSWRRLLQLLADGETGDDIQQLQASSAVIYHLTTSHQ